MLDKKSYFFKLIKTKDYLIKFISSSLIAGLILFFVVFGSYWLNIYSNDPQHFGNMLSNAKDLSNGLLPYKYIFILYGILTTIIHALAFKLGGNLSSIIFATSIAYGLGLVFLYILSIKITNNIKLSSFVIITGFLLHPFVILPWSNYIAFPFIVLGFIGLSNNQITASTTLMTGISFGLAVLAREGLILPISLILITYTILNFKLKDLHFYWFLILGFFAPIIIFFSYLYFNHLLTYWYKISIILPSIFQEKVFHDASAKGILIFFYDLLKKSTHPDYRWFLISAIFVINFIFIIKILINKNKKNTELINNTLLLLCVSCFLLISTSLHLRQIFRIATASVIGLIPFYYFLEKYKKSNLIFFFVCFSLITTLFKQNTGIYDFPSKQIINSSVEVKTPSYLSGQILPTKAVDYYQNIESDFKKIKKLRCNIRYHYNYTRDAFLQVISPFEQYQVAPSFIGGGGGAVDVEIIRPDLNIDNKIKSSSDLMFLYIPVDPDHSKNIPFPKNYVVFSSYFIPEAKWIEPGQKLQLLVPKSCL